MGVRFCGYGGAFPDDTGDYTEQNIPRRCIHSSKDDWLRWQLGQYRSWLRPPLGRFDCLRQHCLRGLGLKIRLGEHSPHRHWRRSSHCRFHL